MRGLKFLEAVALVCAALLGIAICVHQFVLWMGWLTEYLVPAKIYSHDLTYFLVALGLICLSRWMHWKVQASECMEEIERFRKMMMNAY